MVEDLICRFLFDQQYNRGQGQDGVPVAREITVTLIVGEHQDQVGFLDDSAGFTPGTTRE